MSADPNKKTPRTFQCRDVLWDAFEQMGKELECSVDYLINESMKQYARQRGHAPQRTPFPGTRSPEAPPDGAAAKAARLPTESTSRVPPPLSRGAPNPQPPPPPRNPTAPPASRLAPPPPAPPRAPPPLPAGVAAPPQGAAVNGGPGTATLSLLYRGERYPINKDRFVIGRGKQSSDLTLRDPNVSRQHALIEGHNGVYFMVDMGSTNGVTFNGQRVARKPISEGDVFLICDHELLFTYR